MQEITADQLKRKIESGEDIAIIDVRDADAYEDWHIPGAVNVPVIDDLRQDKADSLLEHKDEIPDGRPLVTVCNRGVSSAKAAEALEAEGFDVLSLAGGMTAWSGVWSEAEIGLESKPEARFIQVRRNGKGCLTYFLAGGGEALVVDPAVDEQVYIDLAKREGATITKVLETHVHADHISRARDLCAATGAELLLPKNQRVMYEHYEVDDNDEIRVGEVTLTALRTPGHTGESMCYLVENEALLTGDTLFVESVGRPDLEKGDEGAEDGARLLYQSLHLRLMKLPDELKVFPAHTGGGIAFDGKPIFGRLGDLKQQVELLELEEEAFVERVVSGLSAKPPSHERVIGINEGRNDLGDSDPLDIEAGPNRCAVG